LKPSLLVIALVSGTLLAACEVSYPPGSNPGTEQLRAQLTPAMRRAGVSDACIESLSSSTLASVKSVASVGFGPIVTTANVGYTNPRRREEGQIRAIVRRECPDL